MKIILLIFLIKKKLMKIFIKYLANKNIIFFFFYFKIVDKSNEMTNNIELIIRRPVYQQEDIDRYYDYAEPDKSSKSIKINKIFYNNLYKKKKNI